MHFDEIAARLMRDRCEGMGTMVFLPEETLLPMTGADGELKGQFFLMHASLHDPGDPGDETAGEGEWILESIEGFLMAPE
jgi:hypothetical protein